jgi:hypothetical protein
MAIALKRSTSRPHTDWSALLAFQCAALGLPPVSREVCFHPTRRWRFDLAFGAHLRLAIEVDGGLHIAGAHNRGAYMEETMRKEAEAMALGWRVLHVSPRHVKSGEAVRWIEAALKAPQALIWEREV